MRIGVLQLNSFAPKQDNLKLIIELLKKAAEKQAAMCFLPEAFAFLSIPEEDNSETIEGPFIQSLQNQAKEMKMWLSLGGFVRKIGNEAKKRNSHIIIDSDGNIKSIYDKVHLYNLQHEVLTMNEGKQIQEGKCIPDVIDTPIGRVGLSICYDLRFPEFYRIQMLQGAQILTIPSAFMKVTGQAHWDILIRSRAIENQCFVVAAAQTGKHGQKRESYGHSLVVDPWGKVLLDMQENIGVEVIEIDLKEIDRVRNILPAIQNIRNDLYKIIKL